MAMRAKILISTILLRCSTTPAYAKHIVSFEPFKFPFSQTPSQIAPDHPLYHQLSVDSVIEMPDKIGGFLMKITTKKEFDESLKAALAQANMLAPAGEQPKARLVVRWIGLNAPRKISGSSEATATIEYSLVRNDTGKEIFHREISTHAKTGGGDATMRLEGNARVALVTNLASILVCLDKGARGVAPTDCALTPKFSYQAPTMTFISVPRF